MSNWLTGLKGLAEKAQKAIPIDAETIQKLTLSTPELQAERQRMDEEYKHKVAVKNSLAHMYPWETRDEERDILVEECKEAVMALSGDIETFFGPYQMPLLNVNTEEEEEDEGEKTEEEVLFAEEAEEKTEEDADKLIKDKEPSLESVEKLSKLEPLPPRLADFDLHAHVGLIQKMLKIDPMLVERQSTLSGGGEREKVFWRNYFFHCAFTRYEAGLSIDEIWSDEPSGAASDVEKEETEESVAFETSSEPEAASSVTSGAASAVVESETIAPVVPTPAETKTPPIVGDDGPADTDSPTAEYEIVDPGNDNASDGMDDAFGGELDELEAEIARELED